MVEAASMARAKQVVARSDRKSPIRRRSRTNLPAASSSFVGRTEELEQLGALLGGARLVTVLGPGGMGKTRLALRYAEAQLQPFAVRGGGGVWFVDFSESRGAASALAAAAAVLGADLSGLLDDEATADAIGRHVSRLGRVLIVLDNFESVLDDLARFVGKWLRTAPSARFLVTSRAVLGVDGEQLLPLGPLGREDATDLFLGRASLVRPEGDAGDRIVVAAIVDAIDRMPLAIELAACRTRLLSPSELKARLDRPLELLRRSGEGRHDSVRRAVLDSVESLSALARRLFGLASVLRNGFTFTDAEAVLGAVGADSSVLDGLDELVRTSLLRVQLEPGQPARYAYFETIRDVAEQLVATDSARAAVLRAHCRHYAARATSLGSDAVRELDNLLLAHETGAHLAETELSSERATDALAIALGLEPLLSARGLSRLRAQLFDRTLCALAAAAPADAEARAQAQLGRGVARRELGEMQLAKADFEQALAHAAGAGSAGLRAVALTELGSIHDVACDTRGARECFVEALRWLAQTEDDALRTAREAAAQLRIGHAHRREGQLEQARGAIGRAAECFRSLGNDEGLAAALYELAVVEMFAGRSNEAFACLDDGLAVARRSSARLMEGALTTARGCLLQDEGELGAALEHHAEAARIFDELDARFREASALYYLATTYVEQGESAEALSVLEQARSRAATAGAPRYDALIAACSATALAMQGRLAAAGEAMERAEAALSRVPNEPALAATVSIQRLHVEVRGGQHDGPAALARAEALVHAQPNDDSRFALRALEAAVHSDSRASHHDALVVWPGGAAFQAPGSAQRVELPARSPLRRLLEHLVVRRLEAPGEVTSIDELIATGWPGERMGAEPAQNRAYVAIATLRKRGLGGVLIRTGGGYALSQAVVVRRPAAEPRD